MKYGILLFDAIVCPFPGSVEGMCESPQTLSPVSPLTFVVASLALSSNPSLFFLQTITSLKLWTVFNGTLQMKYSWTCLGKEVTN